MNSIFRMLVISNIVLSILWFVFPQVWLFIYSKDVIELLYSDGYGGVLNVGNFISTAMTVTYVGLLVILSFFKIWSRLAFFYFTLLMLVLSPLYGVSVQGSYDVLVGTLATLLNGAILAMAFFSNISWSK